MKKIILFLIIIFSIIEYRIYNLSIVNNSKYYKLLKDKTEIFIEGLSAPRGRILDINGNVLVDNIGVKTLVYNKNKLTNSEEIDLAYKLANNINSDFKCTDLILKKFWLANNSDGNDLINSKEKRLFEERKYNTYDLNKIKLNRITKDILDKYNNIDRKAASIYNLMNLGYSYDKKIILKNISDEDASRITDMNLEGISLELSWERKYNYEDTLKDIFGNIGSIPYEDKDKYINAGYSLIDIVGTSNLEYQYDKYLQGKKALYKLNNDNTLSLVKEAEKGNDIYLSIDINMQNDINNILKDEIIKGKKLLNTEYYNTSYVLVIDSKTGQIKAMSGQRLLKDNMFNDVTNNMLSLSFTSGSVVKGASHTVGYQNNLIEVNKKIKDSCVKLYLNPTKCSYKSLGYIDDITALKTSSNYYQFITAIKSTGNNYKYDMKLDVTKDNFDLYRNTFKEYGLGNLTGIDLPKESTGLIGKKIAPDLLLNLSIGQYDTYTILELGQYMNTIANNGKRYKLNLLDHTNNFLYEPEILNEIDLDDYYYERIKEGFKEVVYYGTGYGYTSSTYKPAGKTGTSESFLDIDNDGVNDVKTITSTYAMFAPYDDPKYTIVVVSPNVSHYNGKTNSFAYINRYISKRITDEILEKY